MSSDSKYILCQFDYLVPKYPLSDPKMKDFIDNISYVNELADNSPGFIWRLYDDAWKGPEENPLGNALMTISQWENQEALFDFLYKSDHSRIMRRGPDWFKKKKGIRHVNWWANREDKKPDLKTGIERLNHLISEGPTKYAFDLETRFPPPDFQT